MRRIMRKHPCACGSGRPAAACCGRFRRLSESDIARAHLRRQAHAAWESIAPFTPTGRAGLQRELAQLPQRRPELVAALAPPARGGWPRVARAASRWPDDQLDRLVDRIARSLDDPLARVALARTMVTLREDGVLDEHLVAAALVDLDDPLSVLMHATATAAIVRHLPEPADEPSVSAPHPAPVA